MRTTPLPEFQAEAMLPATDFAPVETLLRAMARAQGLELHEGHGRSVWCVLDQGEFGAKKRGENVLVFARAHRPGDLPGLQDRITQELAVIAPERVEEMRWPSPADAGKPPTNFGLVRVGTTQRIARDFLRLRLHGADLDRLAHADSMHFRLVLPPQGDAAPEWPRMGANGQTLWPSGAKTLHRPVYTVRAIDAAAGWLDTDIFLHPGGRVTDWALSAPAGQKVGLSGPSGGGVPFRSRLLLAGDETAYPAMARIIAARPDAQGQVWLLGASGDYPFPDSPGLMRQHLPGGAPALTARLRDDPPPADAFLWMAAEKAAIGALRELIFDQIGHDKHQTHLAAYWSA
ncbi:siderophore-interacting protein [Paracoccus limosus]|uniref:Siderophore-interacting protein n=1 Tax=Paracoccus limosus TaxID=913252 RepID=A0A844H757_9RHOB|nr:siderophore-interacting protein [Paracoccus limosus]MTH35865.1 siderophore-interacting protein [Paracoccus limosus]